MSKKIYTIESVICVLRKDASYLRNYLLIHHVMIPMGIWLVTSYCPSGHLTLGFFFLSIAHAFLFAFYLIYKRLLRRKSALSIYVGIFFLVGFLNLWLNKTLISSNFRSFKLQHPSFIAFRFYSKMTAISPLGLHSTSAHLSLFLSWWSSSL